MKQTKSFTLSVGAAELQSQLQSMAQEAADLKTRRDTLVSKRASVQQEISDLQAFIAANPQYG